MKNSTTMQTSLFETELPIAATKMDKKTIAMRQGDVFSDKAVERLTQSVRITGLTDGRFSLISLIHSVLKKTGPAKVIISTWSAGLYDATSINELIHSNLISDFKLILDRSFKTRQKQYSTVITDLFTLENIRTTDTHSKFVLISNDNWNICIRSSMNLNENKRCENFDIDNDIDIFNLFNDFAQELFAIAPKGIIEDRSIVDPIFEQLFFTDTKINQEVAKTKFDLNFTFKEPFKNQVYGD